jgi:hypothetical protein
VFAQQYVACHGEKGEGASAIPGPTLKIWRA